MASGQGSARTVKPTPTASAVAGPDHQRRPQPGPGPATIDQRRDDQHAHGPRRRPEATTASTSDGTAATSRPGPHAGQDGPAQPADPAAISSPAAAGREYHSTAARPAAAAATQDARNTSWAAPARHAAREAVAAVAPCPAGRVAAVRQAQPSVQRALDGESTRPASACSPVGREQHAPRPRAHTAAARAVAGRAAGVQPDPTAMATP